MALPVKTSPDYVVKQITWRKPSQTQQTIVLQREHKYLIANQERHSPVEINRYSHQNEKRGWSNSDTSKNGVVKVCQTQSADLSVFVLFFLFFYYSFLFFSTATCVLRFLHYFSTNLDEIWHVDSAWWDEQTEYFFKSIGPGVGTGRGPKVLLCFIIGKTLYTVRRDKNFT